MHKQLTVTTMPTNREQPQSVVEVCAADDDDDCESISSMDKEVFPRMKGFLDEDSNKHHSLGEKIMTALTAILNYARLKHNEDEQDEISQEVKTDQSNYGIHHLDSASIAP